MEFAFFIHARGELTEPGKRQLISSAKPSSAWAIRVSVTCRGFYAAFRMLFDQEQINVIQQRRDICEACEQSKGVSGADGALPIVRLRGAFVGEWGLSAAEVAEGRCFDWGFRSWKPGFLSF